MMVYYSPLVWTELLHSKQTVPVVILCLYTSLKIQARVVCSKLYTAGKPLVQSFQKSAFWWCCVNLYIIMAWSLLLYVSKASICGQNGWCQQPTLIKQHCRVYTHMSCSDQHLYSLSAFPNLLLIERRYLTIHISIIRPVFWYFFGSKACKTVRMTGKIIVD